MTRATVLGIEGDLRDGADMDRPAGRATDTAALRPVSLDMCHRVRADDTFATGWNTLGEDRFLVRANWPGAHPFFSPVHGGLHDPLLVVETMRQSAMAVLHGAYGTPPDHHFLLRDITYTCFPEQLGARNTSGEDEVDLVVTFPELHYGGGYPSRLRAEWVIERGGRTLATGMAHARLISPPIYGRLRKDRVRPTAFRSGAPAADPKLVGRSRPQDILLAPTSRSDVWELRADTGHPVLFQRPNDHIPGMLLVEAARQAACARTAPEPFVPLRGSIVFHRYAEFTERCLLEAAADESAGPDAIRVVGFQDDSPVFECVFGPAPA
ncbi:ScbA/BarX family gamma-butyrolactone biosynthesis protein [Streptomyces sp. NPDC003691]